MTELAVAALAAFYYLGLRRKVRGAFEAFGTEVPSATAVALSSWLVPSAVAAALLVTVAALALPLRRSRRMRLLQLAITVLACVVVFAVLAALVPMFNP
ncbi:MAG TPA: hypothetical protein VHB21_00060 [Minicystis sp.]|nr:hypothetical protein [Minicystis sp.]